MEGSMHTGKVVRFPSGQVVGTPNALAVLEAAGVTPEALLDRHFAGDWSEMQAEDREANEAALIEGSRVFSAYNVEDDRVWVITEADRSSTCLLLPEDY